MNSVVFSPIFPVKTQNFTDFHPGISSILHVKVNDFKEEIHSESSGIWTMSIFFCNFLTTAPAREPKKNF